MLVGHRVILRPFRRSDLEGLYDLVADVREIGEFWPLGCISEPRWLKRFEETSWWSDDFKLLLITDLDGRRLGQVNVYKASHSYEGWELGYRIYRPEDRGKGYMTEAARLATAYLFEQEPIERVQILLDPRNEGSRIVAERAGYTLEGTLRGAHFDRGGYHDLLLYSILRSEAPSLAELLAPLND
jgi:ribosomal-protein-alanine N-acetyltransferase